MLTSKNEMVRAYKNEILRGRVIKKAVKYMKTNKYAHFDGRQLGDSALEEYITDAFEY